MANRQSPIAEAGRLAAWVLREIGRELRVARITSGMTQGQVAARLNTSISHISRVEHGLLKGLTMAQSIGIARLSGSSHTSTCTRSSVDRWTRRSWH